MGLVDLDLTLTYARSIGFAESNPFALAVMGLNSTSAVVSFKLLTMLVALWIILKFRDLRHAEAGAWVMAAVMGALMVQWHGYIQGIAELTPLIAHVQAAHDPRWVMIDN